MPALLQEARKAAEAAAARRAAAESELTRLEELHQQAVAAARTKADEFDRIRGELVEGNVGIVRDNVCGLGEGVSTSYIVRAACGSGVACACESDHAGQAVDVDECLLACAGGGVGVPFPC